MRRLSAFLLAFALIAHQSYAQQTKVYTENKSASATLGALNAAVTIDMDGRLGVGVQIDTANLSATVTPEVSCDKGVTWTASSFLTVAGASAATVVFGGGADAQIRQIATIGCVTHVRVRISAYTSGTSVARITATATRAASAGGGAATSVEPGVTTVTGCQNLVLFGDNSQVLNCDADLSFTGGNLLTADRATITTGPFLVATGTAAAPSIGRTADADDGVLLGDVTYFVRDGVETVGASISGSTSSLNFCTSGAAACGTQETLSATTAGLRYNDLILTAATMTAETTGRLATGTSSYTWTNAQVVALGATTTGDITVATLPAKTQIVDAILVITGAAVGPATVTVSCGDAIAGTPFINYIAVADAKAAANTVYGDAVAERGTSLDTEWYYLPSYTATTLVTCHFISTGANLSTVTGSTGRLILSHRLLP